MFANLAIGEITAERVERFLAMQRAESEASAKLAREVLSCERPAFGRAYADWCVRQIVHDVTANFA